MKIKQDTSSSSYGIVCYSLKIECIKSNNDECGDNDFGNNVKETRAERRRRQVRRFSLQQPATTAIAKASTTYVIFLTIYDMSIAAFYVPLHPGSKINHEITDGIYHTVCLDVSAFI